MPETQLDMFNPNGSHLRHPDELFHEGYSINLHDYDLTVITNSTGKDSVVSLWEIVRLAKKQNYPLSKIVISHQDLGEAEWPGVHELLVKQSEFFGLSHLISKRVDKNGYEESLLEYVQRRGKWPSNKQRWCTSDFKRGPGNRVVRQLANEVGAQKVLQTFGFRKQESPARAKRPTLSINKLLTTKSRIVHDFLPVHDWDSDKVWSTIKDNGLPYHKAYDLGMPRLSCVFCIFSPFNALVLAGQHNPDLLNKYIAVEDQIGHTFRNQFSLHEVKQKVESGEPIKKLEDWVM